MLVLYKTRCTREGARGSRTYLPTPAARHTASCPTYLPTHVAYRSTGPTYYEKKRNAGHSQTSAKTAEEIQVAHRKI